MGTLTVMNVLPMRAELISNTRESVNLRKISLTSMSNDASVGSMLPSSVTIISFANLTTAAAVLVLNIALLWALVLLPDQPHLALSIGPPCGKLNSPLFAIFFISYNYSFFASYMHYFFLKVGVMGTPMVMNVLPTRAELISDTRESVNLRKIR